MRKNKNCLKLPPSPWLRWLAPFITLLSQKKFLLIAGTWQGFPTNIVALFFYLKPSERFGGGLTLAFQLSKGSPPPVTWAHAYRIDSGSMNCGIIKVPVNWKVVFFLTILIVDFCSDPKQTKLISQDYSDGDFQSLILNKQYWFPKNILMVIFSFRSSPLLLSFLKVTPSEIVPFTNWRDSWNLTPERFSCLSLRPSGLD